ncbi:MAG TPA: 2Fe-2S iron-sulfur cluster-binding protein [Candidatus Peribacteraceae bacterium]|nr:2Fe-2S iron-sulfur cluster-binding protein [Candidatus Peribacteraceae bacterium]
MVKVTYRYDGQVKVSEGKDGQSLLHIGLDAGVPLEHACGGNGFCTTCMCKIVEGMEHLSPRNDREENMGVMEDPERLTCQSLLTGTGDIIVDVQET